MAGWDDLVGQALPYLAKEMIQATQGTTWEWYYTVTDNDGELVDLTTGYTGTLSIRTKNYVEVLAATVTFPIVGQIMCAATAAASAAVSDGQYIHELTITRTSDSEKLVAVGSGHSRFTVLKKVS